MNMPFARAQAPAYEPPVLGGMVPPSDLRAESACLSAAMLDDSARAIVLGMVPDQDYYSDQHRLISLAMRHLTERGEAVDAVTVLGHLRSRQLEKRAGGAVYMSELVDATPAVGNVEAHCRIVADLARVRRTIAVCQRYGAKGYTVEDASAYLSELDVELSAAARSEGERAAAKVGEVLRAVMVERVEATNAGRRTSGRPTGFVDYDKKTSGLHSGDLTVLAARPGVGKTSFALAVAMGVASPIGDVRAEGVAVFSLEMPKEQLAIRMACTEAGVDLGRWRSGDMSHADWRSMSEAAPRIDALPIVLDDSAGMTMDVMRGKVAREKARFERAGIQLGLVVVDYIQLMSARHRGQNREQEVSEISRGLKQLAKDARVPVLALSQLNRGVESRTDKRPLLSDLRESGAIEQDADNIVFLYRDDYYNPNSKDRGVAELIVAKQRNGPTGTVRVRFVSSYTRFENLASGDWDLEEMFP